MPIQHAIWNFGETPAPILSGRLASEQLLEEMTWLIESGGAQVNMSSATAGSGDYKPNRDAINVLTMRVSKGLEFPVVMLPGGLSDAGCGRE